MKHSLKLICLNLIYYKIVFKIYS